MSSLKTAILLSLMLAGTAPAAVFEQVAAYGTSMQAVARDGSLGAVSEGTVVRILDIAPRANPARKGSVDVGSAVYSLQVVGNLVFATTYTQGSLVVIDASEQTAPVIRGRVATDCWGGPVYVRKSLDYAYVGTCGSVEVISLANLNAPQRVGSVEVPGCVFSLTGDGSHLYAAPSDGDAALRILSLCEPSAPTELGVLNRTPSSFGLRNSIDIFGDWAFVGQYDGILMVDISDKTQPNVLQVIGNGPTSVAQHNGLLRYAGPQSFSVDALAGPVIPEPRVRFNTNLPLARPGQSAAAEEYTYLAYPDRLLTMKSVEPALVLSQYSLTPGFGLARQIEVAGNNAFVSTARGFAVANLTNPLAPAISETYGGRAIIDMELNGQFLYSLSEDGVVEVWNVSNPSNAIVAHQYTVPAGGDGWLAVSTSYAAVAANGTLIVYTRGGNGSLTETARLNTGGLEHSAVALNGDVLYAVTEGGALRTISLANPSSPQQLNSQQVFDTLGRLAPGKLVVDGNRLHMTAQFRGYYLFDISNPSAPALRDSVLDAGWDSAALTVDGNTVYAGGPGACGRDQFRVVNIAVPTNIVEVARGQAVDAVFDIERFGDYLLVGEDGGGLRVREILGPEDLAPAGWQVR